jgi:protein phosphatase
MQAAQDNGQSEHAEQLLSEAMKWVLRDGFIGSSAPVRISLGIGLDKGKSRQENQDYAFADRALRSLPDGTQETVGIFVVADGIGGMINGGEASRLGVHAFVDSVYPRLLSEPLHGPAVKDLLIEGIQSANEEVYLCGQNRTLPSLGMGTTLVAALSVGTEIYVTGVGDSRAYLSREGKLKQLTEDHTEVASLVREGILTPDQQFTHPNRHIIYRALGEETVEIDDPVSLSLQHNDVLLFCSDGLWEMVRDPEAGDIAKILANGALSAEEMARDLVQLALSNGGRDNVGLVVARVEVDSAEGRAPVLEPSLDATGREV